MTLIGVMNLNWTRKPKRELTLFNAFVYLVVLFGLYFIFGQVTVLYKNSQIEQSEESEKLLLNPIGKLEHLKKNIQNYELIFLGSSKTYIGIDPAIIEKYTDKKAFNYGSMAHWFPTQYPQVKKILPYLSNQAVIWTVSHEMFGSNKPVPRITPIEDEMNQHFYLEVDDYFEYLLIGYESQDILDNLLLKYVNENFILFVKGSVQSRIKSLFDRHIYVPLANNRVKNINYKEIQKKGLSLFPNTFYSRFFDANEANDAMFYMYKTDGQLSCMEVKPEYLRQSQQSSLSKLRSKENFYPDQKKLELFKKILMNFQKHNIQLIVNNFWDMPGFYKNIDSVEYKLFMNKIKTLVEAAGMKYISVDNKMMKDEYYFDTTHLNTVGSAIYSKLLAKELEGVL